MNATWMGIAGLPVSIVLRQVQPLAWIIHEDPPKMEAASGKAVERHVQPKDAFAQDAV